MVPGDFDDPRQWCGGCLAIPFHALIILLYVYFADVQRRGRQRYAFQEGTESMENMLYLPNTATLAILFMSVQPTNCGGTTKRCTFGSAKVPMHGLFLLM